MLQHYGISMSPMSFVTPSSGWTGSWISRSHRCSNLKALEPSWCGHELSSVVSTQWLADNMQDEDLVIVDIRGRVVKGTVPGGAYVSTVYEGMQSDYLESHIGEAVFVDWTQDIAGVDENGVPAQLADRDTFIHAMETRGVNLAKRVVVYDNGDALFATRFWWAMRVYGHDQVSILDGGWSKWQAEDRPERFDVECPLRLLTEWGTDSNTDKGAPWRATLRATADDVIALLTERKGGSTLVEGKDSKADVQLVDARAREQYTGAVRRAMRGGHIPGALNTPYRSFLKPQVAAETGLKYSVFKSLDDMRQVFDAAGVDPLAPTLAYCNGGVASTVVLFLMHQLGNKNITNYDGSWNEWGNRKDTAVAILDEMK